MRTGLPASSALDLTKPVRKVFLILVNNIPVASTWVHLIPAKRFLRFESNSGSSLLLEFFFFQFF